MRFVFQRQGGTRGPRGSSDPLKVKALKGKTPRADRGEKHPGSSGGDEGVERVTKPCGRRGARRGRRAQAVRTRSAEGERTRRETAANAEVAALTTWRDSEGAVIPKEDASRTRISEKHGSSKKPQGSGRSETRRLRTVRAGRKPGAEDGKEPKNEEG